MKIKDNKFIKTISNGAVIEIENTEDSIIIRAKKDEVILYRKEITHHDMGIDHLPKNW
jgi:hypothetical protein